MGGWGVCVHYASYVQVMLTQAQRRSHFAEMAFFRPTDQESKVTPTTILPPEAGHRALEQAWYELVRQVVTLTPAELATVARWPAEVRTAPSHCFAQVEEIPESGPHEPGGWRFKRLLQEPTWPWPLVKRASFEFDAGWDAAAVAALAQWQPLRQVEALHVSAHGQDGAAALTKLLGANPQLRSFSCDLVGAERDAVLAVLAALPHGLQALTLQWVRCDVGAQLGPALARLPQLESLALESMPLSETAWVGMVDAGVLPHLRRLRLLNTALDDAAAAIWLRAAPSGKLRHLDVEDSPFNGRPLMALGLQRLAEAGWLDGLQFLRVGYHDVAGPVLAAVLAADLHRLREWLLFCTGTGDEEVDAIVAARLRLPALGRLWLSYCGASAASLQRLAAVWPADDVDWPGGPAGHREP